MTTKRERLEAAIAGQVADRPPVAIWRHFPVDDQDPRWLAEAIVRFQEEYDFDFVKVTPASSYCLVDWGVEDVWEGNSEGTRRYVLRVVETPEDWGRMRKLSPGAGNLSRHLDCLKLLRAKLPAGTPLLPTIFSPLAQAKNLAGEQCLFEHLHRNPGAVLAGLEIITATTVDFISAALAAGADGIFYAIQHASYRYMDAESYARFGIPHDERILEAAEGGWLNVLHLHGDAIMLDLAERYRVQVVNWHDREAGPSLNEGAHRLRGKAVCGGIRRETLALGDPLQVVEEAADALGQMKRRGLVLGTGCVVPIISPHANLIAARRAVESGQASRSQRSLTHG